MAAMKRAYDLTLSHEETEYFVSLYRSHELLWNTRSPSYTHFGLRRLALRDIATKLGKHWSEMQVKTKWNNIKTTYGRELKKIRNSLKSHAVSKDIYVPSWWLFGTLDEFLRPHCLPREARRRLINLPALQSDSVETPDEKVAINDEVFTHNETFAGKDVPTFRQLSAGIKVPTDKEVSTSDIEPTDKEVPIEKERSIDKQVFTDRVTSEEYFALMEPREAEDQAVTHENEVCYSSQSDKRKHNNDEPKVLQMYSRILGTLETKLEQKSGRSRDAEGAFGDFVTHQMRRIKSEAVKDDLIAEIMNALTTAKRIDREDDFDGF